MVALAIIGFFSFFLNFGLQIRLPRHANITGDGNNMEKLEQKLCS